jgi:hypothetical protein
MSFGKDDNQFFLLNCSHSKGVWLEVFLLCVNINGSVGREITQSSNKGLQEHVLGSEYFPH